MVGKPYLRLRRSCLASRIKLVKCARLARASRVKAPCFNAFVLQRPNPLLHHAYGNAFCHKLQAIGTAYQNGSALRSGGCEASDPSFAGVCLTPYAARGLCFFGLALASSILGSCRGVVSTFPTIAWAPDSTLTFPTVKRRPACPRWTSKASNS
jgi:hypothetical protein